jgi:hypothetical protein
LAPAGLTLKGRREDHFMKERMIDGQGGQKQLGNVNVAIVIKWVILEELVLISTELKLLMHDIIYSYGCTV